MRSVVEAGAAVPAFLAKLWKLVNDCDTNHLIFWSSEGKAFCIQNQAEFARELLPLYYKHNNMASFIRQLNMYGFHKVTSVETGSLRCEKDEIEFSHPCFMEGHAYLLEHIKRKIANPKLTSTGEKILLNPELMTKVMSDVKQMKGRQESMDARFSVMKQENEALWREIAILRQKHIKQQQIVNNLIQFLMSLVQPSRGGAGMNSGVKRRYQLMIENAAHNTANMPSTKNARLDPGADYNVEHEEELPDEHHDQTGDADGPTILELAHNDLLHGEVADFITVEVPPPSPSRTPANTSASPQSPASTQQIGDAGIIQNARGALLIDNMLSPRNNPIVTSPSSPPSSSPSLLLRNPQRIGISPLRVAVSPIVITKTYQYPTHYIKKEKMSNDPVLGFNTMQDLDTMPLPADIFADDSVSDDSTQISLSDVDQQAAISQENASSTAVENQVIDVPKVNLHKTLTQKGMNSKSVVGRGSTAGEKKTKSKKEEVMYGEMINPADIKQEWLEDAHCSDMSVATRDSNTDYGRFGDVSEVDDHLESMQNDLESLRELLRGDNYSLDANTLLGLFNQDDPFHGLSLNLLDDRSREKNSDEDSNQLMAYTAPSLLQMDDLNLSLTESELGCAPPAPPSPRLDDAPLHTPQLSLAPARDPFHNYAGI